MRIGWIGGLTRTENNLTKTAAKAGHVLEFHSGIMRGRGVAELRRLVDRSEIVVILTGVNSHQAVWLAKDEARRHNRPFILMQKCGLSSFREFLDGLEKRKPHLNS